MGCVVGIHNRISQIKKSIVEDREIERNCIKYFNRENILLEYKIKNQRLGTGGNEEIMRAIHLRTQQPRTIKIIYKKKMTQD